MVPTHDRLVVQQNQNTKKTVYTDFLHSPNVFQFIVLHCEQFSLRVIDCYKWPLKSVNLVLISIYCSQFKFGSKWRYILHRSKLLKLKVDKSEAVTTTVMYLCFWDNKLHNYHLSVSPLDFGRLKSTNIPETVFFLRSKQIEYVSTNSWSYSACTPPPLRITGLVDAGKSCG